MAKLDITPTAPRGMRTLVAGTAICALLLHPWSYALGQSVDRYYYLQPATDDFETVRQEMEAYYANRDKGKGTGYKQWKRWEYTQRSRLTPDGKIINSSQKNLEEFQPYQDMLDFQRGPSSAFGNWTFMGPTDVVNGQSGYAPGLGRMNVVGFHPTDVNTLYVGAPAGGLWRTTNNGLSWTPLTDGFPNLGISGIAVDPTNANTIYILTGDGDGGVTQSLGVYKSTNNGASWAVAGLSWTVQQFVRGYKLLIHPTNGNILFAATTQGIYRTLNGGGSWTNVVSGSFQDIEFKPGDPNIVYASSNGNFFRSTNTGGTWTQITAGMPTNANRIAIAVSPAMASQVMLLCGPATGVGTFKGVYRSTDSGLNFSLTTSTPNILGGSETGQDALDQSGYDLAFVAHPTYAPRTMAGGVDMWLSLNYGASYSNHCHWAIPFGSQPGTDYVHADIHDLANSPHSDFFVYCASDGGFFWSPDNGNNWYSRSAGLSTTMFYRIADHDPDPGLYIGGTQDNGSTKLTGGSTIMTQMWGGDGMDCIIHPTDPMKMVYSAQSGAVYRSTDGGATLYGITPPGVSGPWLTPLCMDPSSPSTLYGGWNTLYKSTDDGANWTNLGVPCSDELVICQSAPNRIYCSSGSTISTSANGGASFTNISAGLSGQFITGIAVNPNYQWEVFVTVGNFTAGQKVYYSSNAGSSWTNITGSLPNIIVNCIGYDANVGLPDDQLYIGTDVGVFYRDNTLGDWVPFNTNLPAVRVEDIEFNEADGTIAIGTFGRGIWRSELYGCLTSVNLSGAAPGGTTFNTAGNITSTQTITTGPGQDVTYKGGHAILMSPPFKVHNGSTFHGTINGCGPD